MSWQDAVNALFEFGGFIACLFSCWRLYLDKRVAGVSIVTVAFFSSWGYWNIYFYPHLGQWYSFGAGLLLALSNTLWAGMILYYQHKERSQKSAQK